MKKQMGKKRFWVMGVCVFLLGAFLAMPLGVLAPTDSVEIVSAASTSQQLADAKEKKKKIQEELQNARDKINALSGSVSSLSGELQELASMNETKKKEYAILAAQYEAALAQKEAAFDEYILALETFDNKLIEYSNRMSVLMEYQNKSVLEVLLSSDSIAGFFTQMELIALIGEADQQAMEDLRAAGDDAELKKKNSDKVAFEMEIIADAKHAEMDILAGIISATEAKLKEKQAALNEWAKKEDEYEAFSANVADEIKSLEVKLTKEQEEARRLAAEANKQKENANSGNSSSGSTGNPVPVGMFTWPYPGQKYGSGYGIRIHPVYGYEKFHNGLDIGGKYGDKILCAGDGVVTKASAPWAGQNTGGTNFGNHIYVDHGNGYVTIYAHAKNIHVSVGDVVKAGQHIADVGSTGLSTGPHLHFEVRLNGIPTNPASYFKF